MFGSAGGEVAAIYSLKSAACVDCKGACVELGFTLGITAVLAFAALVTDAFGFASLMHSECKFANGGEVTAASAAAAASVRTSDGAEDDGDDDCCMIEKVVTGVVDAGNAKEAAEETEGKMAVLFEPGSACSCIRSDFKYVLRKSDEFGGIFLGNGDVDISRN